jgi:uroporphyrinogen III methyltransferase/synthase
MKRILVTRPRTQADSFCDGLKAAGFEPIYFPVIEIRPIGNNAELDQALKIINKYDWIVFSSANAVDVVFEEGQPRGLPLPRMAAIGPKTADALRKHQLEPDFVPEEFIAEAILPGLGDLRGKRVLFPRAEIARKELPEAIVNAGGTVHEIPVYKTVPTQPNPEGLAALKSGVDVITFTSASTVENFIAIARQNKLDPLNLPKNPLFACIGPITEQAARAEVLTNLIVAKEFTTDGLVKILSSLEMV